ncbi:MAG: phosphodiester glycosidase family protein [Cohnella sp.]|nr:phosphodiester glycosidase family protein [Cohnella sp.]
MKTRTFKQLIALMLCTGMLVTGSYAEIAGPSSPTPPVPPTPPIVPGPVAPTAPEGAQSGSSTSTSSGSVSPFACPADVIRIPLNQRMDLAALIRSPADSAYSISNAKAAKVTWDGLVVPLAKGDATVMAKGWKQQSDGAFKAYTCAARIRIVDAVSVKLASQPKTEFRKVKVGKTTFDVQTVTIPKGMPVDIGLAGNAVGKVEALKSLAARRNAEYAVNGTFFEAYDEEGDPQEPLGNLIKDGEAVHLGNYGTTIGFTADGRAKMDTLRMKIQGGGNGSYNYPNNWYATFANRTPNPAGSSSILFTPARGAKIGFAYGTAIVVKAGIVAQIAEDEDVAIPRDGFVVVLNGAERKSLRAKFEVGKRIHYRLKYTDMHGKDIDWGDVVTAVGAGPRVLKDGKIYNDAAKEGFKQEKILSSPAARSGIGIRKDGSVVIVTVNKATIKDLGEILRAVGAEQGMNLDGGASSGLFAAGRMLTAPGRPISNSLLFGVGLTR